MYRNQIQSNVAPLVGVDPQIVSATGTVSSGPVDKLAQPECRDLLALFQVGAVEGEPTNCHVVGRVMHREAEGDAWETYAQVDPIMPSSVADLYVPIGSTKRYVQVEVDVTLTGGTDPTVAVSSAVLLANPAFGPMRSA